MSSYPMLLREIHMDHSGGTKSYHLTLVSTADGRSLFVCRWGKTGAFGEIKSELFMTAFEGAKAWDKKERSRTSGGYSQKGPTREGKIDGPTDIAKVMGLPLFAKMGAAAINHLDVNYDTRNMRDANEPRYDEDGKLTGRDTRSADIAKEVAAEKARLQAESENTLRKNPNFGRF